MFEFIQKTGFFGYPKMQSIFEYLKRLFGEEETRKETVNFFELEKWLAPKIWEEAKLDFSELKIARDSLAAKAEELQQKDLDKVQVEDRIKDVVKGNRNALVITLRQLLSKTEPPADFSVKSVLAFCEKFYEEMEDFNKRSARNYFISKHLIGEELEEIRKSLKTIESTVGRIHRKAAEGRIMLLEDVQKKLNDIYSYLEEKGKRAEKLREAENNLQQLLEKEKETGEKIEKIKDGEEYSALMNLKIGKEDALKGLEEQKNRIRAEFSELSRPLKKFGKFKDIKAVDTWLEEPVAAVEQHSEKISNALKEAAESMQKGEIDSKNSEKDTQKLKELSAKAAEFKDSMASMESKIKELTARIKENRAEEEKDRLIEELSSTERKIEEAEESLSAMKEKNIHGDIEKIKEDIKKAGFRVKIDGIPFE